MFPAVPVIALFTKFDALDTKAFSALKKEGLAREDAKRQCPPRAEADFENENLGRFYNKKHPPKGHVYLRGNLFLF